MVNFDDFKNEIEYQMDVLYGYGAVLAEKFTGLPLQCLESDRDFLVALGCLRLTLWEPQAAAMLASPAVGIETTADALRVVLAYISTDEAFLDKMTDKAHDMALALSARAEAAAAE